MYKATVLIKRRKAILDPQGKAVEQGAKLLGFSNLNSTRIGKIIEFNIEVADKEKAENEVKMLCDKLLANPNMEDFEYSLEKVK